ncbi:hexadecenal dehydrogenase [Aspergillus saccharolyticus JOP 1030-1]|uniref:Aldehyde dehydrogenase n=1 Tax=Aspergillus saccharolyticus JOP 1030-1 TaxID=1450539 RepID=A0A318ZJ16_9EURO|nr:aldehyde dehydrogenase [Aspergillus saccharolyticus JOP 1030-1]PYH46787.1 aldehyde dehydrogenase [Aspergillus saccharolyticus JOP 1030-1]
MGAVEIPPLQYTPVEEIQSHVSTARKTFNAHKTRDVEYRLVQLRKLYWSVKDHLEEMREALRLDLGRPKFEAELGDTNWVLNDIIFVCRNLENWVKDEKAENIDITFKLMNPKIRKDPLGCVLVIGPFNFPFQLTLGPVIGAIAAGCTVVVKPSEKSSHCAVVIQRIIEAALDPEAYIVVQGGVSETQALLAERWDKIFFTGSANVGRIVCKAAATHMTPIVLELGGLNPAFISRNADPRLVARRLLWGKTLNAGQLCTSQNYMLVERPILPAVVEEFKKAYSEFWPQGTKKDFSRIIDDASFQRIKRMVDNTKGKILLGGTMDEKERFIEPTLVQIDSINDSLVTEESFGPLLTILPVDSLDEAIEIANGVQATPLALYPFGTKAEAEKILSQTRSGGVSINDASLHIPTLEFGGVGESGSGAYRGKASFDVFVHRRAITTSPGWVESALAIRYPPFGKKQDFFIKAGSLTPDFDRNGQKLRLGWLRYLLTLGGGSAKSGVTRATIVAAVAYFALQLLDRRGSRL